MANTIRYVVGNYQRDVNYFSGRTAMQIRNKKPGKLLCLDYIGGKMDTGGTLFVKIYWANMPAPQISRTTQFEFRSVNNTISVFLKLKIPESQNVYYEIYTDANAELYLDMYYQDFILVQTNQAIDN